MELFYDDPVAAQKWLESACHPFGGKRTIELMITPEGRGQVLQELERLERFKVDGIPRTAWRTCRAFYPSPINGGLLFSKTEIPAANLFYHLARGGNIAGFIRENPDVTHAQVDTIFDQVILDLCNF